MVYVAQLECLPFIIIWVRDHRVSENRSRWEYLQCSLSGLSGFHEIQNFHHFQVILVQLIRYFIFSASIYVIQQLEEICSEYTEIGIPETVNVFQMITVRHAKQCRRDEAQDGCDFVYKLSSPAVKSIIHEQSIHHFRVPTRCGSCVC